MTKYLKRIGIGLILLSILCCLTGCGGPKPEDTVETFLAAVKEQDWKTAAVCVGEKAYTVDYFELAMKESGSEGAVFEQAVNQFIEKSEYKKVKLSKEKKDRAFVTAEITTIDFEKVADRLTEKMIQYMIQNYDTMEADPYSFNEEEWMMSMLLEELSASDVPMKTKEVEFFLKKVDEEWIIQLDDDLIDDLTGGLMTAFAI